jgi:hypothetical protein
MVLTSKLSTVGSNIWPAKKSRVSIRNIWQNCVGKSAAQNEKSGSRDVRDGVLRCEDEFVALRRARDATLPILHALQVNIAGGRMPPADDDGRHYLKIPLNALAAFCK